MNKAPIIYNFDKSSGLLISQAEADADPMQPGQWLLPAHATLEAPPVVPSGQAAVFNLDNGWQLLADCRGVWYNTAGQAVQIEAVQSHVVGLVRAAPPSTDHELVNEAWVLSSAKVAARFALLKADLIRQVRAQREIMLNRLMGIAFVANASSDAATVAACLVARQSLLDLTKHASMVGAADEAQLKAAYKALYGAIVAATPAAIRSVYADIQI